MNWHRIHALALRHLYPLKRDFDLLSDMIYWPLVDTIVWGVTSQWITDASGIASAATGILLGLVLWNVIWRSQAEVARNLLDEIQNNNLVNLFSTALTVKEWLVSVVFLSVIKTSITMAILLPAMYLLYKINVLQQGLWLAVFFLGATVTGWWVGFLSAGVVLRHGLRMQTVVWTFPGMLLPFSAVFFPLDRLPAFLQPISRVIPTTYIFETMRAIVAGLPVDYSLLAYSFGLNFLFLTLAIWYFIRSFAYSKKLGLGRFNT
ncbi:MAG: ABC transporter permease [bacterium]|nr:ABC transporter permease [bacterium]